MPLFCDCNKVRLEAARALLRGFDQPRLAEVYTALDQRLLNGEAPVEVGRRWAEQCLTWVAENARLSQENRSLSLSLSIQEYNVKDLKSHQAEEVNRKAAELTRTAHFQQLKAEDDLERAQAEASFQISRLKTQLDASAQQQQQAEEMIRDLKRLLAKYHLSASDELTVREANPPARKPRA